MKRTLTNFEIANITGYMNSNDSIARNPEAKLNIGIAWKLRKNLKKIDDLNKVLQESQQEIGNGYADDDHSYEKDGQRLIKEEFLREYNEKINALFGQENEVEVSTITIDELTNTGIKLSLAELDVLTFMIEDPDDEPAAPEKVEGEIVE